VYRGEARRFDPGTPTPIETTNTNAPPPRNYNNQKPVPSLLLNTGIFPHGDCN